MVRKKSEMLLAPTPPELKKNQNQLLLGHLIGPWCEKRTSIRQTRPQNLLGLDTMNQT